MQLSANGFGAKPFKLDAGQDSSATFLLNHPDECRSRGLCLAAIGLEPFDHFLDPAITIHDELGL